MSKKRLSVKTFFALVLLPLFLISCSHKTVETCEEQNSVSFTDALGRNISVPQNTLRAACLTGSFADVWMLSGGKVCAAADDAFDDFGLVIPDAVNLGATKSPDIEKLFASEPELVIASVDTAADLEMKDLLESAGITVAYFDVDCFDDYLSMLSVCTDITGRKDLYEKNGLEIQKNINIIKEDFASHNIPDSEKTYLFLRASAGYIRAKGSEGTILGEMLSDLGFVNVADSDTSMLENLSIESVIQKDPYRIFIVQVGDNADAVKNNISNMMEETPAWQGLSAVKGNRLYYMDKRLFNLKPNALWAKAYETLCNTVCQ